MNKEFGFSIKEMVVYPGQGVGTVVDITKKEIGNEIINYYVIYLSDSDMTVLIPFTSIEKLGIRPVVSKEQAEKALKFLSEDFEPMPIDWKARYQMNMDLFKSGQLLDIASVVRSLYQRSKTKELPIQERKLYDSAYRIFQDEIAASLNISRLEAESTIHLNLEPLGAAIKMAKPKLFDEDTDLIEDNSDIEEDYDDLDTSDMYEDD